MSKNISGKFKVNSGRFGVSTEEEKSVILEERGAKNTNKSIKSAVQCLEDYIRFKGLPSLASIDNNELPKILEDFYCNARSRKGDIYHTQTQKSMRSNLNRWFQEHCKINIITDPIFIKANLMFKAMQVKAKKIGKGARKHTEKITDDDMARLAFYFNVDHIKRPNPYVLQRAVIFNIIYYLCRRGQENLHSMTKDFFKIEVLPSGERYVVQVKDELDKNHRENSTDLTNQGKMYEVPGK